jgi:hypothetical protein
MAFPEAHSLFTWFGDGWTVSETWQFGLRVDSGFTTSGDPSPAVMDAMAAAGAAFMGGTRISNKVRLLGVKHAKIGTDGKYVNDADPTIEFLTPPVPGSAETLTQAPQCSVAISLTTDRARGFASSGRFYTPTPCLGIGPDGRMTTADQDIFVAGATAFVNAVNAADFGPVTIYSKAGAGAKRAVTGIRVGRVVDTIRSRRSSLDEAYVAAALTP